MKQRYSQELKRILPDADTLDLRHHGNWLEWPDQCLICTKTAFRFLGIVYGYPLFACLNCDAGFVWPQPSDELLDRFYGPEYWQRYMDDERPIYERQPLCDHVFRRQAQFLTRLLENRHSARILDVGAGDGTMLRLMQDAGFSHVLGLDINPDNCSRAAKRLGVQMRCESFLNYTESDWDAITLWAVIEHVKNPAATVSHALQLLKPGGLLVMMTGDNNSLCARLQGCFDMWMYPPEHLFFFGRKSLRYLLKSQGFQDIRCRVGYQAWWKETALTTLRVWDSLKKMRNTTTRPTWRSTASNLLVAWGSKPN